MSEYVKKCDKCGGEKKEMAGTAGRFRHRVCTACNGTGQQLVKAIPEGAVVVTPDQVDRIVDVGCMNNACLPGHNQCPENDFDCRACTLKWLEG